MQSDSTEVAAVDSLETSDLALEEAMDSDSDTSESSTAFRRTLLCDTLVLRFSDVEEPGVLEALAERRKLVWTIKPVASFADRGEDRVS